MPSLSPTVRPGWQDVVPALPLLAVGLLGSARATQDDAGVFRPLDAGGYALVAVAALALLARRRAPLAALVVVGMAAAAYLGAGYAYGPVLLCGPAAAWAVAAALPWRTAARWVAAFVVLVGSAPAVARVPGQTWLDHVLFAGLWAAVVGGVAAVAAARQVRRRSEEGVRAEQARRAVSEERLQMAQDVHDGVGHDLAVIALHAGVALHVLDSDPARARELLVSIRATSRESLAGLRADLASFRSAADDAGRHPAPGLADLPRLLDRMRDGGLALTAELDATDVPDEVGAAAYRIVQESLTNVLRHAGDTTAQVRVATGDGVLRVEVRDHGAAAPAGDPAGSGITGMRRRAGAVHGSLAAGPAPDGGFLVRAELPLTVAEQVRR